MFEIKTYKFQDFAEIEKLSYCKNWPVVYIIEGSKEAYIGETVNIYNRSKEHYQIPERRKLQNLHIIYDDEFNKSATLDIESSLIEYVSADGNFKLQNNNKGLVNHNFFDKDYYRAKIELIWEELKKKHLANNELIQIQNFDLFKFSPYKSLSIDQEQTANEILNTINNYNDSTNIIEGGPGTGKTVLAIYLFKLFKSCEETKNLEIGLVIPMTSLRKSIKKVFKSIKNLSPNMVIGPCDVVKKRYDILIVDEAHRLRQRKNITNYSSFDAINKILNLDKDKGTELDWILLSSKHNVLFYDAGQSVKPSDVPKVRFDKLYNYQNVVRYQLKSQMRVMGGEDYINYIDNILNINQKDKKHFAEYDVMIYNDIGNMLDNIRNCEKKFGLCRIISGIAWEWKTKDNKPGYDFVLDGIPFRWNSFTEDFINSANAINEVGCIHTVQGYDLNYAGVIIGPELKYDKLSKKLVVDKGHYQDINGKKSINNDDNLLNSYIKNIYKTLLTRGIKGTFIYIVNRDLRDYLSCFFNVI